eukprot:jgi/Undpi1/4649/HiC_scaffold_18.g08003.m1
MPQEGKGSEAKEKSSQEESPAAAAAAVEAGGDKAGDGIDSNKREGKEKAVDAVASPTTSPAAVAGGSTSSPATGDNKHGDAGGAGAATTPAAESGGVIDKVDGSAAAGGTIKPQAGNDAGGGSGGDNAAVRIGEPGSSDGNPSDPNAAAAAPRGESDGAAGKEAGGTGTEGDGAEKLNDTGGGNDKEKKPSPPRLSVGGGGRRRSASGAGSDDSDFYNEGMEDLEEDLDKPWVTPSLEHAQNVRKRMIWNEGMRSYFGTTIKEIGSMGVGLYLYFWVIRIMAVVFLLAALLSTPSMLLNGEKVVFAIFPGIIARAVENLGAPVGPGKGNGERGRGGRGRRGVAGNDGMAISETDLDSLGLATYWKPKRLSRKPYDKRLPSSDLLQAFGETHDALKIGYVLVGAEVIIAILFAIFVMVLSERLEVKIREIDDANVTPADYSIMVRGLPKDVTKEEVPVTRTTS